MRQIAYSGALGSCVLGAGVSSPRAAEWSITPNYSAAVDYDSNRQLLAEGKDKGSGASVLLVDLKLKRALEDLQLTLEPRYALRRYTDSSLGNGDDRSVNGELNWVREKSVVDLTASYWDQSTLTSELLQTGLVSADTHRRAAQGGVSWNWNQTERRTLISQLSYQDVSYYGLHEASLPGFRYTSGSLGERFAFSERGSFTLSAYGSVLASDTPGNSSHEVGVQAGTSYAFSERTSLDASLGRGSRVLAGSSSQGTNGSLALNHSLELGRITLGYTRSLVPYGVGFLVEQQQYTAAISRQLTPYLDGNLGYQQIKSNQAAVLLGVGRPSYKSLSAGLNWRPLETWSVGARVEGVRARIGSLTRLGYSEQNANGWHSSITLTWYPFPTSRSW
jgi:hypothetical protein